MARWTEVAVYVCLTIFSASDVWAEAVQLFVTVSDKKTGRPIENLQVNNFSVVDDAATLQVVSVSYKRTPVNVALLVDTSFLGLSVKPLGAAFIRGLGRDEKMCIVGFHESADLLQDFTDDKRILLDSLRDVRHGNNPRILDALFATLDGVFGISSVARRVIVLLAAGVEGHSRTSLIDVLSFAREKRTAIYPIYRRTAERRMFRRLAGWTGGAHFRVHPKEQDPEAFAKTVYSLLRGYYVLELTEVHTLGDRLEVKIKNRPKTGVNPWVSAMIVE